METINQHITEIIHGQIKQVKVRQENIIIDQLRKLGHKFETGAALEKFAKERISIVHNEHDHEWTVWLDREDLNKCYILAIFYDNPKLTISESTPYEMIAHLGRVPTINNPKS